MPEEPGTPTILSMNRAQSTGPGLKAPAPQVSSRCSSMTAFGVCLAGVPQDAVCRAERCLLTVLRMMTCCMLGYVSQAYTESCRARACSQPTIASLAQKILLMPGASTRLQERHSDGSTTRQHPYIETANSVQAASDEGQLSSCLACYPFVARCRSLTHLAQTLPLPHTPPLPHTHPPFCCPPRFPRPAPVHAKPHHLGTAPAHGRQGSALGG